MIKLSILIPSIPSRIDRLVKLFDFLNNQVKDKPVEILSFLDNKKRSIGYKRDALVQIAKGEYLAFVDDDDRVSVDYVDEILNIIVKSAPDLITFNQECVINKENPFIVRFGIDYGNQEIHKENDLWVDIKREPFHSCVWKSNIAKSERFADASYGEDWHWAKRLIPKVVIADNIDKVLHFYTFDTDITEAEAIFPE